MEKINNNNLINKVLNNKYLIVVILFISICFRFINLSTNPTGIFRDEAEKGYNAYSILKTGKYVTFEITQNGLEAQFKPFSLFIEVFGVYTSAIYQVTDIPFVWILGLNEFSTRLPSALIGVLTVLLTYILIKMVYGRDYANISAFLLAISPWHIIFSRWALQGIFVPFFIVVFLIFFLSGLNKKPVYLVLSAFPLALCFYSYDICRLLVPIFIFLVLIIYFKDLLKQKISFIGFVFLFLILILPIIIFTLKNPSLAGERYNRISVFSESNNPIKLIILFLKNYLSHYSPVFLFIKGDELSRHSYPGMGQLNFIEFPLLIFGLWQLIKKRAKFDILLLSWFLIFPIASSLTKEGIPHSLRSIFALPMIHIISAIGFCSMLDIFSNNNKLYSFKKHIVTIFVFLTILTILYLTIVIFFFYPSYSVFDWQYGIKDALEFINSDGKKFDGIIFSGYITGAQYLSLYYTKYEPQKLLEEGLQKTGFIFLPFGYPMNDIYNKKFTGNYYLISYPGEIKYPPADKNIYMTQQRTLKEIKISSLEVRYIRTEISN